MSLPTCFIPLRGMIRVRDAVRECLRTQLEDAPDDDIKLARALLNQAYDRFVSRFGPVSDRVNANAFEGDPDLPLLFWLENYDAEKRKAAKTAIFRERTIHRQKPVTSVDSAKEAVLVSLNEKGRVDLKHMEKLLARPAEDFLPELKGTVATAVHAGTSSILIFRPNARAALPSVEMVREGLEVSSSRSTAARLVFMRAAISDFVISFLAISFSS